MKGFFLAWTHGYTLRVSPDGKEILPDPEHSSEALMGMVKKLYLSFFFSTKIGVILKGRGRRFDEMSSAVKSFVGEVPEIASPVFGTPDARVMHNGKTMVVLPDGKLLTEEEYAKTHRPFGDGWDILKIINDCYPEGNKLICTGKRFMEDWMKLESKSDSLYLVELSDHSVSVLVEGGNARKL